MSAPEMTDCTTCRHANWERTQSGKLHPSGDGRCNRLNAHPLDLRIPPAFWWQTPQDDHPPRPTGGHINRHRPTRGKCAFKDGIGK